MYIKKAILFSLLFLFKQVYSLDIKDIYFIPEFSYFHYSGLNFYGGGLSIDKDWAFSKRFSLTTGLAYSINRSHVHHAVDPSSQLPSSTATGIGFYYLNSKISQLFIPVGIKYFLTASSDKKLSVSLGLVPVFYLQDKEEGAYYRRPYYTQPFDPGPYISANNFLATGRRSVFSITNTISIDYCYPLSPKLAINFRGTVMKGIYTKEPFTTFIGIGIKWT